MNSNGDIVMNYKDGSICTNETENSHSDKPSKRRLSSSITFKCDPKTVLGSPISYGRYLDTYE